MSVKTIESATLLTIQSHVDMLINTNNILDGMNETEIRTRKQAAIDNMIERNLQAVRDNREMLVKTCEHLVSGVITKNEYGIFKVAFNNKITEAENNITMLRKELDGLADNTKAMEHIERFKAYGNIQMLNRRTVATLIKSITICGNKEIAINLRYSAEFGDAPLILSVIPPVNRKVVA